ncbi:tRNA-specific adenosine deaminase 2 [Nematocida sp. AWRm77]|nr:tRNA-specific adenosine deaminase 2 [Nematocida sp. AWRm77]
MEIALEEAKAALLKKEVPIGCAVFYNGKCLEKAHNLTNTLRTPLAHAEMLAYQKIRKEIVPDTELFVTCEPCIMCMSMLAKLGVKRITYGCANPKFGGCTTYNVLSVFPECEVQIAQSHEKEAVLLLQQFYTFENTNAPPEKRKDKSKRLAKFLQ